MQTQTERKSGVPTNKISKVYIGILLFNLAYLSLFCFLFTSIKNYEFLLYVATVAFFVIFIGYLHLKFNFNPAILIGLSLWGFLHMLGGFVRIGDGVLYGYQIIDKFLRFDQLVHMYGFGMATLFAYYILRPSLNVRVRPISVSVLLVFIGMGLGSLNEIIEFAAVLAFPGTGVGGYYNTLWDMVFNTVGAIIAVIYLNMSGNVGISPYSPTRKALPLSL